MGIGKRNLLIMGSPGIIKTTLIKSLSEVLTTLRLPVYTPLFKAWGIVRKRPDERWAAVFSLDLRYFRQ